MAYRVRNITAREFRFEDVVIPAGKVSDQMPLEIYQRLLALNHGTSLLPVEDEDFDPERDAPQNVEEPLLPYEAPEEDSAEPTPLQELQAEDLAETEEDIPVNTTSTPTSFTVETEVEVEVPAPAVAEPQVEAVKKRGRPRKNQ